MLRTRWAAAGAAVAVTLGAGGLVSVGASVTSGERAVFVSITPCRLFDTRPGDDNVGPKSTPLGQGETFTVAAHGTNGSCTIPADAVALGLNVTAVGATANTFLTISPTGTGRPLASSLNPAPGQPPTPNAVTVDLSPAGQFDIFNLAGSVNVFADVVGFYADHNHDDRYYTKAQIDVDEATEKWISISPAGVKIDPTDGVYQSSAGGDSGLILIDETNASYGFGFTMPPDYTTNTSISIDLTFRAVGTTPCVVGLRPNTLTISRVGVGLAVLTTAMPSSFNTASPGATKPYKVTVPVATTELGMAAGDAVNISFFRPTDTCTGVVFLQGIMVRYT